MFVNSRSKFCVAPGQRLLHVVCTRYTYGRDDRAHSPIRAQRRTKTIAMQLNGNTLDGMLDDGNVFLFYSMARCARERIYFTMAVRISLNIINAINKILL